MIKNLGLIGLVIVIFIVALLAVFFLQQSGLIPSFAQGYYTFTSSSVLEGIEEMSLLTTTRYNYSSVITTSRDMPGILATLYGEQQVMVAVGYINAGIDLGQLREEDVTIDGNVVTVHLPGPAMQDCVLDETASYVVSRDTGIFARSAPNLDTAARRYAIEQFKNMALEAGIMDEVNAQAEVAIRQFMDATLPDEITARVVTTFYDPNTPLPDTCQ